MQRESAHGHGCACAGCCGPQPETAPAQAAPANAEASSFSGSEMSLSPAGVLGLQRSIGNAAVAGLMRSAGAGPTLARRTLTGEAENPYERWQDASTAKQAYIDGGQRGPEDFRSSTGLGGFNVAYDPSRWDLEIILRGGVTFLDGMDLVGGNAVPRQPHGNAQTAADAINALPADQRQAAVDAWKWNDAGKTAFLTRFEQVVMQVWSLEHVFHCSREFWEDLAAFPQVSADVHDGAKGAADHMQMTVYKVPDNFTGTVGVVNSPAGTGPAAARSNRMTLNSNDVEGRRDNILNVNVGFTADSDDIDPAFDANVDMYAIRFQSGGPVCGLCGNPIESVGGVEITATVRGDGADPEARARARYANLITALTDGGMADAATKVTFHYGGTGTMTNLRIGDGEAQIVAAHEAGHMFGLGDRYATTPGGGIGGTGPSAGLPSRHDELARNEGLEGAKAANDDGIMSWGNEVRPADYATFLEALKHVSGIDEWELGWPEFVEQPMEGMSDPGDFPTPDPDSPTRVA